MFFYLLPEAQLPLYPDSRYPRQDFPKLEAECRVGSTGSGEFVDCNGTRPPALQCLLQTIKCYKVERKLRPGRWVVG